MKRKKKKYEIDGLFFLCDELKKAIEFMGENTPENGQWRAGRTEARRMIRRILEGLRFRD